MLGCAEGSTLEPATHTSTEHAATVCLACGCACDDIRVLVRDGRIAEARRACDLGVAWFGDGSAPDSIQVDGRAAPLDEALRAAASLLARAQDPLVFLAPDLSCEAQRHAVALADRLRATLDSVTSATALSWVLAGQEVGRAGATLGEIRHRADLIVFWGTDPLLEYPRFAERYLTDSDALHLPDRQRRMVAVDIGSRNGPANADVRVELAVEDEVAVLTLLAESITAPPVKRHIPPDSDATELHALVDRLRHVLKGARYVALVADCEGESGHDRGRARAFLALGSALNAPTRCAAVLLRGGGNRSGADAVMTSQTGFPGAVDFGHGYPRYRPFDGTAEAKLARGEIDAAVVLGAASRLPPAITTALGGRRSVVVGPRASAGPLSSAHVVIDTGTVGIHHGGTALRMDDVALPLRPIVAGPPAVEDVLAALGARIGATSGGPA